tara:strand:- start:233 stop:499 length:267 start_codon:yes stop_codon:yes gene_type:complete
MRTLKMGKFNIDGTMLITSVKGGYVNITMWVKAVTPITVRMTIQNAKTHGVIKQIGRQLNNTRYTANVADRTKLRDFLIKNEAYITTP